MRLRATMVGMLALLLVLPALCTAQVDSIGNVDTLYADVIKVDDNNWAVTFSYTTDAEIAGLSIPFKMDAGLNRIVADSIQYTDRVNHFDYKVMRVDTAIQCVTIGLVANLGTKHNKLYPGVGPIATVYISSLEEKPIKVLNIDTTTTNPSNSLMTVADPIQGTPPDTTHLGMVEMQIWPAFVARQPEK